MLSCVNDKNQSDSIKADATSLSSVSRPPPWLFVLGIGEDGLDGLTPLARSLLARAEILIGGSRHLALLPAQDPRPQHTWPRPLAHLVTKITEFRPHPVCVLASGDPMSFGIGSVLVQHIPPEERIIIPVPGAFSLACARLGWAEQDCDRLTLHGRPLSVLLPYLQPGAKLLILSENAQTPPAVAKLLCEQGWQESKITVFEHMGGPKERCYDNTAAAWNITTEKSDSDCFDLADLNMLALICQPGPQARILPRLPGLPDTAYRHDGQITKAEIRAITLAALQPVPGQLLWDIGAGCGSVAIEWLRTDPRCRGVAIEKNPTRIALIAENANSLGVSSLHIQAGSAPAILSDLDPHLRKPDAVFIGGGITVPGLLDHVWQALRPGGRLVANIVTLEGEKILLARYAQQGGHLTRISISSAQPIGPYSGWRPSMTVTQYQAVKPI